jgi:hypothetical protein
MVRFTKNYARYRIIDPDKFESRTFRIIDPGRKGHTKLVVGKIKKDHKWKTQAVLISKKDYNKGIRYHSKGGIN